MVRRPGLDRRVQRKLVNERGCCVYWVREGARGILVCDNGEVTRAGSTGIEKVRE